MTYESKDIIQKYCSFCKKITTWIYDKSWYCVSHAYIQVLPEDIQEQMRGVFND